VETAWRELEVGVANATCLDDIIDVHDNYLNHIQDRALLSEQHETLNMQVRLIYLDRQVCRAYTNVIQIQQVIQAILRFCSLEEALVSGTAEFALTFLLVIIVF
jgi:hypothetical protein